MEVTQGKIERQEVGSNFKRSDFLSYSLFQHRVWEGARPLGISR